VDDLNAATGLAISNEAYDTVGGWVLDLFGRVPRKGERVETPELSVTVEKVERTRVDRGGDLAAHAAVHGGGGVSLVWIPVSVC